MKATKEQIIAEATRRAAAQGYGEKPVYHFIIDVVREGWTPPEPVDPDVLAYDKWCARLNHDPAPQRAYLAGARMATEREQERARGLVDRLSDLVERVTHDGKQDCVTGVNAGEMISARVVLAKHRGEA